MSASTTTSALGRSRSLRLNPPTALKPVSTIAQPSSGPSNITLFLTNLRLLDLDLRKDWPDINALTFSTKDSQQNQKKRIQCVEWALFQLFALWDPEQTRDKLHPFFPPLEPLQSLNLRAALFRCLDQAKKNGALGRDTVLRKTMLDECKGERLEEVLAVFSNVVLKHVVQQASSTEHKALAQQLALENFSYTGERSILQALILAHKASLHKYLQGKKDANAKYRDFNDLLNLNERRIARRHEQLKQVIAEGGSQETISTRDVRAIQDQVEKTWPGNKDWLEAVLYGDSRAHADGVLATGFEQVWKHVEGGNIGEIESKNKVGLLEQLNARVKDQENRLSRWQDFGKTLRRPDGSSPSKKKTAPLADRPKIDLKFNQHQDLQVGNSGPQKVVRPATVSVTEYSRLIENMKTEMVRVGGVQPRVTPVRRSLVPKDVISPAISPISNDDLASVEKVEVVKRPVRHVLPSAKSTPATSDRHAGGERATSSKRTERKALAPEDAISPSISPTSTDDFAIGEKLQPRRRLVRKNLVSRYDLKEASPSISPIPNDDLAATKNNEGWSSDSDIEDILSSASYIEKVISPTLASVTTRTSYMTSPIETPEYSRGRAGLMRPPPLPQPSARPSTTRKMSSVRSQRSPVQLGILEVRPGMRRAESSQGSLSPQSATQQNPYRRSRDIGPGDFQQEAAQGSMRRPESSQDTSPSPQVAQSGPFRRSRNMSRDMDGRNLQQEVSSETTRTSRSSVKTPTVTEPQHAGSNVESESDQILNSVSAASPSPKKLRHTLSLAERTRLSMARVSHNEVSDLHDEFEVAELPRLPIKSRPSISSRPLGAEDQDKHADLIERTRKSMAGFEAAQKQAQLERRQSVKDAKKKQRESTFFPKVAEEMVTPDISAIGMTQGDPDYESVFKSRPKIKTSPAVSPTRISEGHEN